MEGLLAAAGRLESALDDLLDGEYESVLVSFADWAWYRFATARALIRDGGSGTGAACLARGLLEEAAYWDWKVSAGADEYWMAGRAITELERLISRASPEDDLWVEWLMPPGAELGTAGAADPPSDAADAVARMGHGLNSDLLTLFPIGKLKSVYRLLDVSAHGNLVAAALAATDTGYALSEELSALVLHVAGSAATAITVTALEVEGDVRDRVIDLARTVVEHATLLHGVTSGDGPQTGRPARALVRTSTVHRSSIERMPPVPPTFLEVAREYCVDAMNLVRTCGPELEINDAWSQLASQAWALGISYLESVKHAVEGNAGLALVPYVARPLVEEAARWRWCARGLEHGSEEFRRRLAAMLAGAGHTVEKMQATFRGQGLDVVSTHRLLGPARHLPAVAASASAGIELDGFSVPRMDDLLAEAYASVGGGSWIGPIYGILSQFIHATPLAQMHLKRDTWPSLSAPMAAVALDAAAHGFTFLSYTTLSVAGVDHQMAREAFQQLFRKTGQLHGEVAAYHLIG